MKLMRICILKAIIYLTQIKYLGSLILEEIIKNINNSNNSQSKIFSNNNNKKNCNYPTIKKINFHKNRIMKIILHYEMQIYKFIDRPSMGNHFYKWLKILRIIRIFIVMIE